ncbi:hypothetical protein SKM_01893 [Enterococcus faecium EnGen0169]|nr:hypothetical protein SKM_01893 [Enterococcus faecium EnGen0169]
MKVSQKIILSILLLLTLVVGYFSIEFIHGFSSAKQSSTVKKVEPKSVPTTLNVALIGSDARSKDENGRSDSLSGCTIQPENTTSKTDLYHERFICRYSRLRNE